MLSVLCRTKRKKTAPFFLSKRPQTKNTARDEETLPEVFASSFLILFPKMSCSLFTYLIQQSLLMQ